MSQRYGSTGDGKDQRFVAYLERLAAPEDRGALAVLRQGLRGRPGEEPAMYRYVVPWVQGEQTRWGEDVHYLVAALFAFHPKNWPEGTTDWDSNLGASFARIAVGEARESVERRFTVLLNTHQADLAAQLRHAISLLKSRDVPVDWGRLLNDLRWWGNDDKRVQRRWAKVFWGRTFDQDTNEDDPEGSNIDG